MLFDTSNMKYFRTFEGYLICNMCEQSTTIDDSISCKGRHLICNDCASKIACILGITFGEVVIELHSACEDIANAHMLEKIEIESEKEQICYSANE